MVIIINMNGGRNSHSGAWVGSGLGDTPECRRYKRKGFNQIRDLDFFFFLILFSFLIPLRIWQYQSL